MALWADLMVNDDRIGSVIAVRTAGGTSPDSMNTYAWERVIGNPRSAGCEYRSGVVKHRYGDGAAVLLANVLLASEKR